MTERTLIVGALVVDPSRKLEAIRDVLIEKGKIREVAAGLSRRSGLKDVPRIDARGCWAVPGLIDMHCHLREPGREGDETLATGTAAAARGGFTAVLAMANTEPAADNASLLNLLRAKAAADAVVDVYFAGAVTVGLRGERLTEFASLKDAGAAALSDDGRPIMDAGLFRRALELARDAGLLVIDHCEDLTLSSGACVNEGAPALAKGLKGAPWAAETVQVVRDIALAEMTGAPVHVAHLSAAASVEAVRAAKKRGVRISAEACPHHFSLTEDMIPGYDGNWKMNPPLRADDDRRALWAGLADGTIDVIATDHAPHGCGVKSSGIDTAPFGVIGLETALAAAITTLVKTKRLTPSKLVERMALAPARLLGLRGRGTLAPGADADVALIDPTAKWTPQLPFSSKSANSPFIGEVLYGRVVRTIRRGLTVHAL